MPPEVHRHPVHRVRRRDYRLGAAGMDDDHRGLRRGQGRLLRHRDKGNMDAGVYGSRTTCSALAGRQPCSQTGLLRAVIALLAACSGGTVGGTKAPASGGSGKTFDVSATEFQFAPDKFDASVGQKVTFKVTNKGTVEHTFVILSPDGSQELAKLSAQPGETKSLEFTPQDAGTYPIDCNIAGHKEAGMTGELAVK